MAESKPLFHEQVAANLIEQLKAGTAPWQKPWAAGELYMPQNPVSGHQYKGVNTVNLLAQGKDDPRWMTYKQAESAGAQVRPGEKGTTVQYWKFDDRRPKLGDQGQPVLDDNGKKVMETVRLERPRAFYSTVFNATQIDGLPPLERKEPEWDRHERADAILGNSGASLHHDQANRAFYRPGADEIHLPRREQFETADNYYATALHEVGHSTGHPSRLDRDLSGGFGSQDYAKEELRAEIASLMIGNELGIGHDPGQHAAYVGSWIQALEDDPKEILRASRDAEKIMGHVLALEHEREQGQTLEAEREPGAPEVVVPQISDRAAILAHMPELKTPDRFRVMGGVSDPAARDILITSDHKSADVAHEVTGIPVVVAPTIATLLDTAKAVQETYPDKHLFVLTNLNPNHEAAISATLKLDNIRAIEPPFTDQEIQDGRKSIQDFYACRENPEQAIRETIVGGIEAAKVQTAERETVSTDPDVTLLVREFEAQSRLANSQDPYFARLEGLGDETLIPYGARVTNDGHVMMAVQDGGGQFQTFYDLEAKTFDERFPHEGASTWVGQLNQLNESPDFLITADYLSAIAANQVTGLPVVVAFEDANLPAVSAAIHEQYPEKNLFIVGHQGHDNTVEYETQAAERSGAELIYPRFTMEQIEAGHTHLIDYVATRGAEAGQAIRETIEGGIEAAVARMPEREQMQTLAAEPEVGAAQAATEPDAAQAVADPIIARLDDLDPTAFMRIGGEESFQDAPDILVTTHGATAALIHEATWLPVVMVHGEDQLLAVTQAVINTYPDKDVFVVSDRKVELGSEEAQRRDRDISEQTRAEIIYPQFAYEEGADGEPAFYVGDYVYHRENPLRDIISTIDGGIAAGKVQMAEREAALVSASEPARESQNLVTEKTYLYVSFDDKDEARTHGARWDGQAKSWYAPEGTDLTPLAQWREAEQVRPGPDMDPRVEFTAAIKAMGLQIEGLPEMDGEMHRVTVDGGTPGKLDGAYVGHLDGRPAGYIQNHKTGVADTWKAKGYSLNGEQKAELQADAAAKREAREEAKQVLHEEKAVDCQQLWRACLPLQADAVNPYLASKGVGAHGVREDPETGKLVVPGRSTEGKIRTLQFVDKESKRFYAGAKKTGHFHLVGTRQPGDPILIAEGYATAASIHEATGRSVVVAFDSGNLKAVAEAVRQKEPETPILICGDDDHQLGVGDKNVGRSKAQAAAHAVGGKVLFPAFTADEREEGKAFTDFNDLHRGRGLDTVRRQVEAPLLRLTAEMSKEQEKERAPEQEKGRQGTER